MPVRPDPASHERSVTGSQFVERVRSIPKAAREQMILTEVTSGNIPVF